MAQSVPGGPHTPAPVSESTAAVVRIIEGSQISLPSNAALTAGWLCVYNNSGAFAAIGFSSGAHDQSAGVAMYDTVSGERVTFFRGDAQCFWDGAGTLTRGVMIGPSDTRSGWFVPITAFESGNLIWGTALQDGAAANSGTRRLVRIR